MCRAAMDTGRDTGEYHATRKFLYHPGNVALIKEGRFRDALPISAQLSPTLYCNFRCPRCSYGKYKSALLARESARAVHMNWQTMASCLDGLAEGGVKAVLFTGGGEPTVNRHTLPGMQRAKEKGLEIGLFTNGSIYDDRQWSQLLDLEPTFIRISLDAASPEVHHLLHGYASNRGYFQDAAGSLLYLAKQRQGRSLHTTIGVSVSIEPVNLDELQNIAGLIRDIDSREPEGGVDYVVFRPVVNFVGGKFPQHAQAVADYIQVHRPEYHEAYLAFIQRGEQLPPRMVEQANAMISEKVIPALASTGTRVISIETKMQGIHNAVHPFARCRAAPWYPFVGPDGSVYNCVDLALDPRTAIGNITTQTLAAIWQSARRQQVMDYIDAEGLANLCPPVCACYELNELLARVASGLQGNPDEKKQALLWIDEQEARAQSNLRQGTNIQAHYNFM